MYTFVVTEIGYFICPSDYLLQYSTLYKVKFRKSAKKKTTCDFSDSKFSGHLLDLEGIFEMIFYKPGNRRTEDLNDLCKFLKLAGSTLKTQNLDSSVLSTAPH